MKYIAVRGIKDTKYVYGVSREGIEYKREKWYKHKLKETKVYRQLDSRGEWDWGFYNFEPVIFNTLSSAKSFISKLIEQEKESPIVYTREYEN